MHPVKLFCIFSLTVGAASKNDSRLNVLLIILDDLRPTLGSYGDDLAITPNIDSLLHLGGRSRGRGGGGGAIFDLAFAQQALCAPSRNSFLTSRRPDTTGLYDFYSYWRHSAGNFTTMPQYFTENGYTTHSVGKVFHPGVSSNWTDDAPYSWNSQPFHPSSEIYMNAPVCPTTETETTTTTTTTTTESGKDVHRRRPRKKRNLLCAVDVESQPEGTLPDMQSGREAVRFLRSRPQKPFFLAVGFHKPHVPFRIPKQYLSLYPLDRIKPPDNPKRPQRMPDIAWNPWQSLRVREDIGALNLSFPYGPMPPLHTRLIRQYYYAAVSYVDEEVGRVLRALDQDNLADETVVALVGDHGWALGEHQEWAKFSNFDVAVRVPWIIRVPNAAKTTRIRKPVELLDLFPTLADLAGLPAVVSCPRDSRNVRLCTEGKSRARQILRGKEEEIEEEGDEDESNLAFSQYPRPSLHPTLESDQPRLKDIAYMGYSVRSLRYRCTEWVSFDPETKRPDWSKVVAIELYDHEVDPEENHNKARAAIYRPVVERMRRHLRDNFTPSY